MSGRDVFALLPTGGGKSLCYQLPALARPGLTVVVSPLIALMKDQVDALQSAGAPATFLNSSLDPKESGARYHGLHLGEFKLLYVSPERLLLPGFFDDLERWQVCQFAIDEAHCVSEWGHDFRPEYRQLRAIRERFPKAPFMALTATATERVREDIVEQLQLRNTAVHVAGFNRPNLTYRVEHKDSPFSQIIGLVNRRQRDSGIVYCSSRKATEDLASRLVQSGVSAAAYHAGLPPEDRARRQEAYLRDEIRVMCATIAFGMGVHKPDVRFVIHYDMPKNLESYYQETGRAGRDGLPSECLLLFSPGDFARQLHFLDEKTNPEERKIALAQLTHMRNYAESPNCRRVDLLSYFGDEYYEHNCGSCDNCLSPKESWDASIEAQKLLSCIFRVKQKTGFNVGLTRICEILLGSSSAKILEWGLNEISTYGIGKGISKATWQSIGRQLIRIGLVEMEMERQTISITPAGWEALKSRSEVILTKSAAPQKQSIRNAGSIECDEALFEKLRQLRKKLADERGAPPYVIFSDVSLRNMAREYPKNNTEFLRIPGVGDKKLEEYGDTFMQAIADYLQTAPKVNFTGGPTDPYASSSSNNLGGNKSHSEERVGRAALSSTVLQSLEMFEAGQNITQIAQNRSLSAETIYGHLEKVIRAEVPMELSRILSPLACQEIAEAVKNFDGTQMKPVVESLGGRYGYGQCRFYVAWTEMAADGKLPPPDSLGLNPSQD